MANHKNIELPDGSTVKVDASDYEYLSQWKWNNVGGYAARVVYPTGLKGASYRVLMHRVILACPEKLIVDHINHETLDNRKENLRIATRSQNQWNTLISKNNTSGHKGINWDRVNKKWRAGVGRNDKYINLGRFDTIEEAVAVRIKYINNEHGEFARQS